MASSPDRVRRAVVSDLVWPRADRALPPPQSASPAASGKSWTLEPHQGRGTILQADSDAALYAAGPELQAKTGHRRSLQPNPPAHLPSPISKVATILAIESFCRVAMRDPGNSAGAS